MKKSPYSVFLIVAFTLVSAGVVFCQADQLVAVPVVKYKKNIVFDVSSDGKLALLYGAKTPEKSKNSKETVEWKPKRGDDYLDILHVVDWASGRELGSLHLHIVPSAARFTEDGKKICYSVRQEKGRGQSEYVNLLWDYQSGETSNCSFSPENETYKGSSEKYLSKDRIFRAETSKETVRQFLIWTYVRATVTVYNHRTSEKVRIVLHPTIREPLDWPLSGYVYSVAFTPDGKNLLTSYEGDTYVWRLDTPEKK